MLYLSSLQMLHVYVLYKSTLPLPLPIPHTITVTRIKRPEFADAVARSFLLTHKLTHDLHAHS